MMDLQNRVEELEKRNRSLGKTVNCMTGIVIILGGYLGYHEANRQFSKNRALMSGDDTEFRLFATTDGVGRGLWALAPQAGGGVVSTDDTAGMYLYDLEREGPAEGGHKSMTFHTRAKLETNSTETLLALYDVDLKQRIRLQVTEDGPSLVFYDEDGKTMHQVPSTDLDAEDR